jgi:FkbM family methyltransferase
MTEVQSLDGQREDIRRGITRFLAETRLSNVRDGEGREWLEIPGHASGVIRAPARRRSWLGRKSANAVFFEETTTLVVSYLLGCLKPKTFFDVGSWRGQFSLVAASHLQARSTVHAFEMRPAGIDALSKRLLGLELPGSIHAHLAGLSDHHVGLTKIWYARMKMFEREPAPHEHREAPWRRLKFFLQGNKERALRSVNVLVTSLDQFCTDFGVAPDLMKIDVDGYEGKVLLGARSLLRHTRPTIVLELHKDEVQRDGISRTQVVDMLFDAGYSALFLTDHHNRERCEIVPAMQGDPLFARQQTDMIIFIPPSR